MPRDRRGCYTQKAMNLERNSKMLKPKAVIFDIDNTLTDDVSWLKVTELLGASVEAHIDIFDKFTKNELSYEVSKRQLIQLRQDTGNNTKSFWEGILADWPLNPEAKPLVDYVVAQGYKIALVTGSLDIFAASVARQLSVPSWYANTEMTWDDEGNLVDFHYVRDQAAQKLVHLTEFTKQHDIALHDCIVIGDGDNDIEIFKATGRGIAIGKDNPVLMNVAWKNVENLHEIKNIIHSLRSNE